MGYGADCIVSRLISHYSCLSRYRIISMSSPGVAAQDTPDSKVAAPDRAVLSNGLDTILATGGCIAA